MRPRRPPSPHFPRLVALLSLVLAWGLHPGPTPGLGAQALPDADALIEAYVEAIGGEQAHLTPPGIRTTGTVEVPGMGLRGEFELRQVPPDRMWMRTLMPGMGELLTGFDGETGWSLNPITGPALMEGRELAEIRERAHFRAAIRDPEFVVERETVGREEYGDEACWKVRLTWASERESFDCYSVETGLLVASEDTQTHSMGQIPVTTEFHDYEEFHGMRMPTRIVQRTMGQEQVMTIQEVSVEPLDPSEMVVPPEIGTLLEGR